MSVTVTTPPAALVTAEEAKTHLRVDHADDDAYIGGLIMAAQGMLDGPSGILGRAIGLQTLELHLDGCAVWPSATVDLPYPPLVAGSVAIRYVDPDGVERDLDAASFVVTGRPDQPRLVPAYQHAWPTVRRSPNAMTVSYGAGYATPPAGLKHAALLLIGHWYANRETVNIGNISSTLPFTVDALIGPFRVWNL